MRLRCLAAVLILSAVCDYSASAQPSSEAGIEGVITMSPARPGPLRRGDPESKPLPDVGFVVQHEGKTVATFQTDDQGRFHVLLKPGHYTVPTRGSKIRGRLFWAIRGRRRRRRCEESRMAMRFRHALEPAVARHIRTKSANCSSLITSPPSRPLITQYAWR